MTTYKKSGVDVEKADELISFLKPLARKTFDKYVANHIGGYGSVYNLDTKKYKNPVIVTSTDGVGTKLKIAFLAGKHDTIGIDLVAMCVNDILCCGAEPKIFLDYYATGKLNSEISKEILKGVADGCKEASCSLVGGETAEMPGFYNEEEYDLAGFCVGLANKTDLFDPKKVKVGDSLIGLAGNGLHSNGYSLVRKIIFDDLKMNIHDSFHFENLTTVQEELLKPTKIYVSALKNLRKKFNIKGAAHITGEGIPGNLPRILPAHVSAQIKLSSWKWPSIFRFLQKRGHISQEEMLQTFNCGIGMILVVEAKQRELLLSYLKNKKETAWHIGSIISKQSNQVCFI